MLIIGRRRPGRALDEVTYLVERTPPYRVTACIPANDGEMPIAPVLLGLPAEFILRVLEPEQPTLLSLVASAIRDVRVGRPSLIRYRAARYGGAVRLLEIVDRGAEHPTLYAFCRVETAAVPYRYDENLRSAS
jgi:hypothetical protein